MKAQEIKTEKVPVQNVSNQLEASSDATANKETKAVGEKVIPNAKAGQIDKLKARIHTQKEKLERERLGGELPGDYIAAQEEKIIKMERKLTMLLDNGGKRKGPIGKSKYKKKAKKAQATQKPEESEESIDQDY